VPSQRGEVDVGDAARQPLELLSGEEGEQAAAWDDGGDAGAHRRVARAALGQPRGEGEAAVGVPVVEGDWQRRAAVAQLHQRAVGELHLEAVEEEVAEERRVHALAVDVPQRAERVCRRVVEAGEVGLVEGRADEHLPHVQL